MRNARTATSPTPPKPSDKIMQHPNPISKVVRVMASTDPTSHLEQVTSREMTQRTASIQRSFELKFGLKFPSFFSCFKEKRAVLQCDDPPQPQTRLLPQKVHGTTKNLTLCLKKFSVRFQSSNAIDRTPYERLKDCKQLHQWRDHRASLAGPVDLDGMVADYSHPD